MSYFSTMLLLIYKTTLHEHIKKYTYKEKKKT